MAQTLKQVVIVGGLRIPFCRSNSSYAELSNMKMLSTVLNGMVERYGLAGEHIGEVNAGAVITHSRDWNLAREAVLSTKLAPTHAGADHAAGLRYVITGGDDSCSQDCNRPDRLGHCRW